MNRLSLTVAYLVKNEEEYIQKSLSSVALWAGEILVADTGSTDQTPTLVNEYRDTAPRFKSFSLVWEDDFAKARNQIAAEAHYDWILFVDGDEVVDEQAPQLLGPLTQSREADVYSAIQRNYVREPKFEDVKSAISVPHFSEPLYYFDNLMERFYRRSSGVEWTGRIHESLFPSLRRLHLAQQKSPLILHHFGRLKKGQREKLLRYLELTQQKLLEEPQNASAVIEFMLTLMELDNPEQAFQFATAHVRRFSHEPEVVKVAYQAALRSNHFQTAEEWIRLFLGLIPDDHFARSQLTTALLYQNKQSDALALALENLIKNPSDFVSHLNAAVVFFEKQMWSDAARHLKEAERIRPHDPFVKNALQKVATLHQSH